MTFKQNWDNTKLADYLLLDYWHPESAVWVLAGFKYPGLEDIELEHYIKNLMKLNNPKPQDALDNKSFNNLSDKNTLAEFKRIRTNYERLRQFWLKSKPGSMGFDEENEQPPAYFIKWALSKRIRPDWLDWAIGKGLYKEKQETSSEPSLSVPLCPEMSQTDRDKNVSPNREAWMSTARQIGKKICKEKPSLNMEQIAKKTHQEMTNRNSKGESGMTGRGGRIPCAETIRRHALKGIKS